MRLVVLASGRGSNLLALLEAIDGGHCRATVAAVISDRSAAPALEVARRRGISTETVPPKAFPTRKAWDQALADRIGREQPDLVVLAGFMRILGAPALATFPGRIVNVHPALLPSFPGTDGPAQALRAGVRISGCTVHIVDQGVDTGPIIAQATVPVWPDDDEKTLHARIQRVEHRLLPAVVDAIGCGQIRLDAGEVLLDPSWRRDADAVASWGTTVVPPLWDHRVPATPRAVHAAAATQTTPPTPGDER